VLDTAVVASKVSSSRRSSAEYQGTRKFELTPSLSRHAISFARGAREGCPRKKRARRASATSRAAGAYARQDDKYLYAPHVASAHDIVGNGRKPTCFVPSPPRALRVASPLTPLPCIRCQIIRAGPRHRQLHPQGASDLSLLIKL